MFHWWVALRCLFEQSLEKDSGKRKGSTSSHSTNSRGRVGWGRVSEWPVLQRLFIGKASEWQALALKCCLHSSFCKGHLRRAWSTILIFNNLYFWRNPNYYYIQSPKGVTSLTWLLYFWVVQLSMYLIIAKVKAVLFKYSRRLWVYYMETAITSFPLNINH